MNTKIKPNIPRIILGGIFSYLIFIILLIGLFIGANMYINSISGTGDINNNLFVLKLIKYFIYFVLTIIGIGIFFSFANLIGFALTTKYTITENYISTKTTFIDEIVEDIPIKQITNIDYTISWFLDKIFNTGSIAIYTSGSAGADMYIYGINSVTQFYDNIKYKIDSFRRDILDQKESKLVKTVKPNITIATLLTTIGIFVGYIFILIYISISFGSLIVEYIGLVIFFIIFLLFITAIFTLMAYKKKKYDFYTDKLEYYDGFLTFHKVSVPLERITNIDLIISLFDRIFGVSKIKIETAGSEASEIHINYVLNGEKIVSELKEVLKENGRN